MNNKIGLALGSGSARGWAHIGVIQGLAELGIEPEIISGSSMGALVGAAYAADKIEPLGTWACSLTWKEIVRFLDPTLLGGGLIQGEKLNSIISEYVKNLDFESLDRKLGVVATDLESGREIWFREGAVLEAVRASISLPGLFTPTHYQGRWLVDGGLANPVPVSLCRAMGADIVIAVNLNGDILGKHLRAVEAEKNRPIIDREDDLWGRITGQLMSGISARKEELKNRLLGEHRNVPGLYEVLASSINIMQDKITRSRMAGDPPDVMLVPRLSRLGLMEFDEAEVAIDEGLREVRRMRPALMRLLEDGS
jgi:NTE family protein